MSLRAALVNANWAKGGDRDLILDACALADVVAVVEAIYRDGKPLPLARWAPEGWTVIHDTRDAGRAGVALLVRDPAATITRHRLVLTTRLSSLRPRYTLLVDVVEKPTGEAGTVAATHFPPPRIVGGRQAHARKLRSLLAQHPAVLLGADVNMRPDEAGDLLGLDADGAEVMAWLWSEHVHVDRVKPVKHPGSDHPIVTARVRFPAKEAPVAELTITQRVVRRARALGVEIYEHHEWGSIRQSVYASRRRLRPVRITKADTLVGHITVTFDSGDLVGDFFADMKTVERIGYERFGSGFSYNFGFDNDAGRVGVGMPLDAKGTHTVNDKKVPGYSYDQNHAARAFGWIGVPGDRLSPACRLAMVRMMAAMILEGALTEEPDVVPHSLFAAKDCPTDTVRDELPGIRREALALVKQVRAGETPTTPKPAPKPKRRWKKIRQEIKHLRDLRTKHAGNKTRVARLTAAIKSLRQIFPRR